MSNTHTVFHLTSEPEPQLLVFIFYCKIIEGWCEREVNLALKGMTGLGSGELKGRAFTLGRSTPGIFKEDWTVGSVAGPGGGRPLSQPH